MSHPKPINGFQHSFRATPILEHKAHAPVDSALSTTPVANSGLAAPEHADVCPVSKMRRSSSTGCPVSHGAASSPPNRYYRAAPASFSPTNKTLPPRPADNDDISSPVTLPDVSNEINPCYEEYDEDLLYSNLRERVKYLTQFVNFTEHDVEALNDFQPILLPIVPQLVDNVYHHLFKFDVTKKVFMPRKEGHEGRMLVDLHDLALDAPQIELRKRTFAVYMRKLVTLDYDDFATWQYFDHIGIMHTGQNELKHRKLMGKAPLFVDLMHLSLLLAWTLDVLTPVILSYTEYPLSRRIEIMQAFQKVIWIQNDLFSRHYARFVTSNLDGEQREFGKLIRTCPQLRAAGQEYKAAEEVGTRKWIVVQFWESILILLCL
ncbi:hypothetical protein EST38_g7094 [Candolleomyces aberdarensis]|uniref:Globin-sensor domain-containing protein n=1 Tax=Candolleomyces aberdarensis TaxID=2316362 RepID=A0A4Q2DGG7_9AGAR|nr:hypothetical protein EST38_g7094 [Candolleomyces aberdarensis]